MSLRAPPGSHYFSYLPGRFSLTLVFLCSSDAGVPRNVHAQKPNLQSGAGEACGPERLSSRCLEDRKHFLAFVLLSLLPRGICFTELKFAANEARMHLS